jgi:hypothetical protein
VADRDLSAWLPEVELDELAGTVDRALERAWRVNDRPHLAQVVVDDRLRALEAERLDQLADAHAGERRVIAQQAQDLVLERVELRALGCTPVASGASLLSARRIVSRRRPVRRWISWIDSLRTKCRRRTSAHCSTPTTSVLPDSLCADEPRL